MMHWDFWKSFRSPFVRNHTVRKGQEGRGDAGGRGTPKVGTCSLHTVRVNSGDQAYWGTGGALDVLDGP